MVLQKRFPAFEHLLSLARDIELEENFPKAFLVEMEEFIRRNSIVNVKGKCRLEVSYCCPKCLKAYAISKAKQMGVKKGMNLIEMLDKECGHDGYYLDKEELKPV